MINKDLIIVVGGMTLDI